MAGTMDSATQTSEMGSDEEAELGEKKKMGNSSPRVVIDTSPPFGSVEEAVIRFGGRGFWIPRPLLPLDAPPHQPETEESDIYKLEERAAAMLKDLHMKEQETLDLLKELELTKQLVEELKLKLPKEAPEYTSFPCLGFHRQMSTPENKFVNKNSFHHHINKPEEHPNSFDPSSTAELIMMELKQAKLNLYQSTNDLAAIRASVESLSKKMEKEKDLVEKAREIQTNTNLKLEKQETLGGSINPLLISRELRELNYEAEQFMRTAEAARSEVLKAMSDIEQTKTGLKVIEMRWVTAKKLEEAARAAESLALAEIRALSSSNNNENTPLETYHHHQQIKPGRISLSLEEYSALADKAQRADHNLFKRPKELDHDHPFRKKIEEATEEKQRKMEFRNSLPSRPRRDSRLLDANEFEFGRNEGRQTTSIGEILSRKLVVRDDLDVVERQGGEGNNNGRPRVSLNQMLRQQRGERETSPIQRREKDNGESKHLFSKRKGLRFVHISLPLSKHSKNKIQALNLW